MARHRHLRRKRRHIAGTPPGTLVADPQAPAPSIRMIGYGPAEIREWETCTVAQVQAERDKWTVLWVDISGLGDATLIAEIGGIFALHGLALEDVMNVHQRPKTEIFDDHVFIVLRSLLPGPGLDTEQVSLFVGERFVLTFQERANDRLEHIRVRIRQAQGRVRRLGPDYLAYRCIDTFVDAYFPVLEAYGEMLEELEDDVVAKPDPGHVKRLHGVKRDLLLLRRVIWPTREMLNALIRDETPHIAHQTRIFLRDVYDHAVHLMDFVETYREVASGLLDVYLSSLSTRMNEIMKVLTMIATLFIPLSFLTGLWGMNFDQGSPWNQPELRLHFGYPLALGLMACVAATLIWFFRRKGWIGGKDRE